MLAQEHAQPVIAWTASSMSDAALYKCSWLAATVPCRQTVACCIDCHLRQANAIMRGAAHRKKAELPGCVLLLGWAEANDRPTLKGRYDCCSRAVLRYLDA